MMLLAMALLPAGDAAGKMLTALGVSPWFVAWSRFVLGAAMALPLLWGQRPGLGRALRHPLVWLRAAFITGGISSILTALRTEALADVFGAFFVGPLLSYLLAIVFLKERADWRRIGLLLLGFGGVILVVKPGFGMTPGMGFALLAGVFYGAFLTTSRAVAGVAPPRVLLVSQLLIGAVALAPMGLGHLPAPGAAVAGLALLSALGSMLANLLLIAAYARAQAGRLAPLVYFQLVSATALGWLIFGTLPDLVAVLGLFVVTLAGLAGWAVAQTAGAPRGPGRAG